MKIDNNISTHSSFYPQQEQHFVFIKKIKGPDLTPVGRLYHLDLKNTRKFQHLKKEELILVKVKWVHDKPVILRHGKHKEIDQVKEFIISDIDKQGHEIKKRHVKEAIAIDELSDEEYRNLEVQANETLAEFQPEEKERSLGLNHKIVNIRADQKKSHEISSALKIIQMMQARQRSRERGNIAFARDEEKRANRHAKEKDALAQEKKLAYLRLSQRKWEVSQQIHEIPPHYPIGGNIKSKK